MSRHFLIVGFFVVASAGCDLSQPSSRLPTAANPTAASPPVPSAVPAPPYNAPGPLPGTGTRIAIGDIVRGTVEREDPMCFPNWDASGRCRRFKLDTGAGGVLRASLKWSAPSGADLMDLFAMGPDGTWVGSWDGTSEELVIVAVGAGLTYDLLVMSYSPSSLDFELTAEMQK